MAASLSPVSVHLNAQRLNLRVEVKLNESGFRLLTGSHRHPHLNEDNRADLDHVLNEN